MAKLLQVYLLCLLLFIYVYSQSTVTIPPNVENGIVYVPVNNGETNVTLVCEVFTSPDTQIATIWTILRPVEPEAISFVDGELTSPADLIGGLRVTGDIIPDLSFTYETNLTIVNFTSQFDNVTLRCGEDEIIRFILGFPGKLMKKLINNF